MAACGAAACGMELVAEARLGGADSGGGVPGAVCWGGTGPMVPASGALRWSTYLSSQHAATIR